MPQAHPRVSGENVNAALEEFAGEGSSPRERGKLCVAMREMSMPRLIPA